MVDFSLTPLTSTSFFVQNLWKLNYLPSHLLSSIMRFDFIFRLDGLLSWKHCLKIKLKLQKCWWKLELIHSWEINGWDPFPGLPFLFMSVGYDSKRLGKRRELFWSWKIFGGIWERFWKIERFEMNLVNTKVFVKIGGNEDMMRKWQEIFESINQVRFKSNSKSNWK